MDVVGRTHQKKTKIKKIIGYYQLILLFKENIFSVIFGPFGSHNPINLLSFQSFSDLENYFG